jgi:transcriptional regulator with XRE-family HTH domain
MARPSSPIVDRRMLASALRSMREAAGLSLDEAATQALDASAAKLSRIETGKQIAGPRDVRDLCQLYHASDARTRTLVDLAHSARERGWWEEFDLDLDDYVGLESAAVEIQVFEPNIIPALLQTPAYSAAFLRSAATTAQASRWDDEQRDQFQAIIRIRQERILGADSGIRPAFVLEESALLRMENQAELREQIHHIRGIAATPGISVRFLPLRSGSAPPLQSGFTNLTLHDRSRYSYLENMAGGFLLESSADTERLHDLFNDLQSQAEPESRTDEILVRLASNFP